MVPPFTLQEKHTTKALEPKYKDFQKTRNRSDVVVVAVYWYITPDVSVYWYITPDVSVYWHITTSHQMLQCTGTSLHPITEGLPFGSLGALGC